MRKLLSHSTFIKAIVCLVIVSFSIFILNSCTKNAKETTEFEETSKKETASKGASAFSVPLYCEDLENPCTDPACQPYYDCEIDPFAMTSLFSSLNSVQLQQVINSNDSFALANYLYPYANAIANHISVKYGQNITNEIGDLPQAMILLGLFEYGIENNIPGDELLARASADFDCFWGAIGSVAGITDIVGLYNDFKNGATPRTVIRAAKTILRRVATIFTIASAVIGLGSCMDWW